MSSNCPAHLLMEHAPRALPSNRVMFPPMGPVVVACQRGAHFVDELFRDRRISSVEWKVLRQAIWPVDPDTGKSILQIIPTPIPSSPPQAG